MNFQQINTSCATEQKLLTAMRDYRNDYPGRVEKYCQEFPSIPAGRTIANRVTGISTQILVCMYWDFRYFHCDDDDKKFFRAPLRRLCLNEIMNQTGIVLSEIPEFYENWTILAAKSKICCLSGPPKGLTHRELAQWNLKHRH